MAEDGNDGLSYLLFLTATTVVILILVGWFTSRPDRERQIARECNTIRLADRSSECFPAEDQSRR
jgi:hypothetical protein